MWDGYDGDVVDFTKAMKSGIMYGQYNMRKDFDNSRMGRSVPYNIRDELFITGREYKQRVTTEQNANKKTKANASKNGDFSITFAEGVSYKKLNKSQKAQVDMAQIISQAMGFNLEVFRSPKNALGKSMGENGSYNTSTNTMRLDIDAGTLDGKSLILFTQSHELTHFIKEWSPEKFKVFADFLVEKYGEKDVPLQVLVQRKIDESVKQTEADKTGKHHVLSYDEALEEVVCDACEDFLADPNIQQTILMIAEVDQSIAQKIKNFIKNLINRLERAIRGLKGQSLAAQYTRSLDTESIQELKDLWVTALVDSRENVLQARKNDAEAQKNTTDEGDVKLQVRNKEIQVISNSDIKTAQSIGRKSINNLSSTELNNLSSFAKKYWQELGVKSPFFRAWFGDWRGNDITPVTVATIKGDSRGLVGNTDTGWDINVSGQVFNETNKQKSMSSVEARPYLPYIRDIIKNAVLLDSCGIAPLKSDNSLLMHSLYAVADIGNGAEVLKVYVEEMYDPGAKSTNKRAYQLKNIEKAFTASVRVQGKTLSSLTNTVNAIKNVADLFALVKQYDKNFSPKPASKVVNADGTPKVMYHGTPNDFTAFDKKKTKSYGYYGRGFYFTDSESHSRQYGNSMAEYLDVKNPLEKGKNSISKKQLRDFLEAVAENEDYDIWNYGTEDISKIVDSVYKNDAFLVIQDVNATAIGDFAEAIALFNKVNKTSYDGVITPTETIVYEPTQIKSAVDNIGTFDGSNPDIRFSLRENVEETKDLIAVHNLSEENLLKSLKLGGLPMPSIAIIKAKNGHNNFGDISLVFDKSTIDPKLSRYNKVFTSDAYTPTYPHSLKCFRCRRMCRYS